MYIHNLEERIPYTFSVRAQTIDDGPPAIGNVTKGPFNCYYIESRPKGKNNLANLTHFMPIFKIKCCCNY